MDTKNIHVFETGEKAAQTLAHTIAADFFDGTRDVLLLLSGGSSLDCIGYFPTLDDASFLTISVIDERDDRSGETGNFRAIEKTRWFKETISHGASFIDPLRPIDATKEAKAEAFEKEFRKWKADHKKGLTAAIIGTKPDGHTMGVFPSEAAELFTERFCGAEWVTAYTVPDAPSFPDRITATLTFLQKETDAVYCYVCGEEKRSALAKAVDGNDPLHEFPIGIIRTIPGVRIFTDLRS